MKTENIANSVLCVESGYEYNREVCFFSFSKVMDRELTLVKCKFKIAVQKIMDLWVKIPIFHA